MSSHKEWPSHLHGYGLTTAITVVLVYVYVAGSKERKSGSPALSPFFISGHCLIKLYLNRLTHVELMHE